MNQGGTADHSINEDFDSSLAEKRFSARGVFCLPSNRRSLDRGIDPKQDEPGRLLGPVTPLFDKPTYRAMVERAKHYIREGDIFQIVLSNRLSAPFSGTLLDTYRILRTTNPSPYMFYFSGTDVEVAGASPETLVKLEDGVIDVAQYGKDAPEEVGKYVKTMKDALR